MGNMFDIILENASVLDGSGRAAYDADVGIKGATIEKIGDLKGAESERRVDVAGRTVCPGFIDVHSHADFAFLRENHADLLSPLVRQGITTFVGGNCGLSLAPLTERHSEAQMNVIEAYTQMDLTGTAQWDTMAGFMEKIERDGILLNAAMLAPHGNMRISATGLEMRLSKNEEIDYMKRLLEESLEAGAFGMSTGLQYFPGSMADTRELVELAKSLKRYDAVFTSHMRSYASGTLPNAIDEVAEVARVNDIHGQISHIFSVPWFGYAHGLALRGLKFLANHPSFSTKAAPDFLVFGMMNNVLKKLERHRSSGVDVSMDIMPTQAGHTTLLACFPPWVLTGNKEKVLARLSDRSLRAEMLKDIEGGRPTWPHRGKNDWSLNLIRQLGWDSMTIMAMHSEKNKPLEGRRFTEIAEEQGKHPFDVMCDLLLDEAGQVRVFFSLSEPDDDRFVQRSTYPALVDPNTMIVTDVSPQGFGKPSCLLYGCYPKFINRYVFETDLVDLPTAIKRCTSLPASKFGIKNRGLIKEGYFADLLVMEPENFKTDASFHDPEHSPEGLDTVIINGKIVLDSGEQRHELKPGMVLRKNDQSVS